MSSFIVTSYPLVANPPEFPKLGVIHGTIEADVIKIEPSVEPPPAKFPKVLFIDGLGGGDKIIDEAKGPSTIIFHQDDVSYTGRSGGTGALEGSVTLLDRGSGDTVNFLQSQAGFTSSPVLTDFNGILTARIAGNNDTVNLDAQGVLAASHLLSPLTLKLMNVSGINDNTLHSYEIKGEVVVNFTGQNDNYTLKPNDVWTDITSQVPDLADKNGLHSQVYFHQGALVVINQGPQGVGSKSPPPLPLAQNTHATLEEGGTYNQDLHIASNLMLHQFTYINETGAHTVTNPTMPFSFTSLAGEQVTVDPRVPGVDVKYATHEGTSSESITEGFFYTTENSVGAVSREGTIIFTQVPNVGVKARFEGNQPYSPVDPFKLVLTPNNPTDVTPSEITLEGGKHLQNGMFEATSKLGAIVIYNPHTDLPQIGLLTYTPSPEATKSSTDSFTYIVNSATHHLSYAVDVQIGSAGNDVLKGSSSAGAHVLIGGGGNDLLYAGHGTNNVYGVTGNNNLYIGDTNFQMLDAGKAHTALQFQSQSDFNLNQTDALGTSLAARMHNIGTINMGTGASLNVPNQLALSAQDVFDMTRKEAPLAHTLIVRGDPSLDSVHLLGGADTWTHHHDPVYLGSYPILYEQYTHPVGLHTVTLDVQSGISVF